MIVFYVGIILILAGLGTVAWLLYTEKQTEQTAKTQTTEKEKPQKEPETTSQVLRRLGLEEKPSDLPDIQTPQEQKEKRVYSFLNIFGLKKIFQKFDQKQEEDIRPSLPHEDILQQTNPLLNPAHPTPLKTNEPIAPTPERSQAEIELSQLSQEHAELKQKYERLDGLFEEKGKEFDNIQKALANELKNRKEFNKVKDLLEKELKDNKENSRKLQIEFNQAQIENSGFINRINQLEQKITQHEKTILADEDTLKQKEQEIDQLKKKIQASTTERTEKTTEEQTPTTPKAEKTEDGQTPAENNALAPEVTKPLPEEQKPTEETGQSFPPTEKIASSPPAPEDNHEDIPKLPPNVLIKPSEEKSESSLEGSKPPNSEKPIIKKSEDKKPNDSTN
ncbi:MAG: hypothetical protein WC552_01125 [Candidatus Omnitrophota bacterium]